MKYVEVGPSSTLVRSPEFRASDTKNDITFRKLYGKINNIETGLKVNTSFCFLTTLLLRAKS